MSGIKICNLIKKDAQRWWYYRELRARGNVMEAKSREKKSILDRIGDFRRTIENNGYVSVGRGGVTLHMDEGHTLEDRCGRFDDAIVQVALLLKIPVIDTTTVPNRNVGKLVNLPMIGMKRVDSPPYGCMSCAPLAYVAAKKKKLGATIYNIETEK